MPVVPVVDLILHPPLRILRRTLIPGLFTGSVSLTRPAGLVVVNAYGLTWSAFTIPDGYGRIPGTPTIYQNRLLQGATVHRSVDGNDMTSEWHDFHVEGTWWVWENPWPVRVLLTISPGVQLVLYWITL